MQTTHTRPVSRLASMESPWLVPACSLVSSSILTMTCLMCTSSALLSCSTDSEAGPAHTHRHHNPRHHWRLTHVMAVKPMLIQLAQLRAPPQHRLPRVEAEPGPPVLPTAASVTLAADTDLILVTFYLIILFVLPRNMQQL